MRLAAVPPSLSESSFGSRPFRLTFPRKKRLTYPMLIGAHSIIYSRDPDADRAFFRDVLKLPSADVGGGWLIFGLPPAEVAVHPSDKNDMHEFYLMCDDIEALIGELKKRSIACAAVQDEGWGLLTRITLPGGGKLGLYQPRHARPVPMSTATKESEKGSGNRVPKRVGKR